MRAADPFEFGTSEDIAKQETNLADKPLPLSGIKVLDLTQARAGPTCVRHLADWGADVIRIEQPPTEEERGEVVGKREGVDYQNLNRNKKAVTLNFKDQRGHDLFMRLAKDADVIVENQRAKVKFRLGIDYETIRKINPRIVYGSISGFGQEGPIRGSRRSRPCRPGHERADVDHRQAGRRTDARRHRDLRSYLRYISRSGHHDRSV